MQRHLYLDIETIPAQRPDVLAEIREEKQRELAIALDKISAPGNYKDPEKIAAWLSNEGQAKAQELQNALDADVDAAYRKTGLDGAFGQVCVIGSALNEQDPLTWALEDWQDPPSEGLLLADFASYLQNAVPLSEHLSTTVIGHNVANFDLRFLVHRHIINGVRPHGIIARAVQAKPWETDRVYDTMMQWAGVGRTISLDKLCKALGVPTSKGGITGATVWDEVKAGRIDEVAKYCANDVVATRECHKRMTFADHPLTTVKATSILKSQ